MAKQTVNLGTVANDDTGDDLRTGGGKLNDNFDELYLDKFNNVVIVNSASDFPAASGGVRELIPTPGDSIAYIIDAVEIDLGSDRFTVTSGDLSIFGTHRSASRLKTTNAGTFFTCVDSGTFLEKIGITCASGQFIDFTVPTGSESFVADLLIILDCDTIGTIDGAFTTSLRTMSVVDTQTGGLTWTGTTGTQINISNFLGISWTGTLLDLGTATFDIINMSDNNRFISPAATTILSGAASSANLTASGRALVTANIFNGAGTALSGIDTMDLKWEFKDNIFEDGTTINSRKLVDVFLNSSTTTTITTQSVYVAIAGANWLNSFDDRFTTTTAGLVTYDGIDDVHVTITSHSTIEKVGGGTDQICTKIAINGTVQDKTTGCTENATPTGVASIGLFTLSTNDTIQLFVGNESSTANITTSFSTLIIEE